MLDFPRTGHYSRERFQRTQSSGRSIELIRTFAHIVNPVRVRPSSDLFHAQPLTFESLRRSRARALAAGHPDVRLFTAQYPEDHPIPEGFEPTPDLDRSSRDLGRFIRPRRLPLFGDILARLYRASEAENLIYTNVDIAVHGDFYLELDRLVAGGLRSFVINRRTVRVPDGGPCDLDWLTAQPGEDHPGFDCFIFQRSLLDGVDFHDLLIGTTGIGKTVVGVLSSLDPGFRILDDLHLTFHLNDDAPWRDPMVADYRVHNARQAVLILREVRDRTGVLSPLAGEYLHHYENFPVLPPRPSLFQRVRNLIFPKEPLQNRRP
jgi:hypothetical protein